ncbi:hypothetical protein DFH08DRAFT_977584 [Mycena albidolilacea]|uniref:Uncharacterized protein n=1 Tax=Mycena albidolilacea TaxID=1033008 RepID=A0AAD6Z1E1_9AGAR|nr:hypothetical protein DFH08DRAFT_977584 [Mycena albidolilacea]
MAAVFGNTPEFQHTHNLLLVPTNPAFSAHLARSSAGFARNANRLQRDPYRKKECLTSSSTLYSPRQISSPRPPRLGLGIADTTGPVVETNMKSYGSSHRRTRACICGQRTFIHYHRAAGAQLVERTLLLNADIAMTYLGVRRELLALAYDVPCG